MEVFKCPEKNCQSKFTRRSNLNRHYQNFHLNNELIEKCILCGQMFQDCEDLQNITDVFIDLAENFMSKKLHSIVIS